MEEKYYPGKRVKYMQPRPQKGWITRSAIILEARTTPHVQTDIAFVASGKLIVKRNVCHGDFKQPGKPYWRF